MSDILRKTGTKTPKTKVYKSESHKLCQAFPVAKNEVIEEGAPVALLADGTIKSVAALATPAEGVYIGVATSNSANAPYPGYPSSLKDQTVMVTGMAITYGVAGEKITKAGYVAVSAVVNALGYTAYKDAPANEVTPWIALGAAEKDELVQILVK